MQYITALRIERLLRWLNGGTLMRSVLRSLLYSRLSAALSVYHEQRGYDYPLGHPLVTSYLRHCGDRNKLRRVIIGMIDARANKLRPGLERCMWKSLLRHYHDRVWIDICANYPRRRHHA